MHKQLTQVLALHARQRGALVSVLGKVQRILGHLHSKVISETGYFYAYRDISISKLSQFQFDLSLQQ